MRFVAPPGLPLESTSEFIQQAACGLMSVHGRASGRPQALGVDYLAALNAALAWQASLAAAVGQLRGGQFTQVSLDPLRGGLLSIGQYLAGATAPEDAERLLPGQDDALARPPFVSLEGTAFELETLNSQPWRHFWHALGLPDSLAGKAWQHFLLRYAKAVAPMPAECLDALARLPLAQIRQQARASGVALVILRSPAQRQADADYPASLHTPWRLTPGPQAPLRPAPRPAALPLQGLRVLESCRRIQGPLAGHLLALLGAEVIRLEPPGGDPLRHMPPCADGCSVRFDALNHLKTVREVDIKSAAGRAEIHALCADADVFLHNWAPGKAAELGLDAADLQLAQPSLVHAYAGGWGDAPVSAPGTDFTVQAWSGVAERIARASGTRGGTLFTALDVLGGVISAQGICAALLDRSLHGRGNQVHSSLLGAADLLLATPATAPRPACCKGCSRPATACSHWTARHASSGKRWGNCWAAPAPPQSCPGAWPAPTPGTGRRAASRLALPPARCIRTWRAWPTTRAWPTASVSAPTDPFNHPGVSHEHCRHHRPGTPGCPSPLARRRQLP